MDFNRAGASSNFQKPVAVKPDDKSGHSFPAPNAYNLSDVQTGKKNVVTAEAAFKSKTKRDVVSLHTASNPAPCQYTIQDQLMHHSASLHQSVFKSKTNRGDITKPKKVNTSEHYLLSMHIMSCMHSTTSCCTRTSYILKGRGVMGTSSFLNEKNNISL